MTQSENEKILIQDTLEERLVQAVKQMEQALAQDGSPDFKSFWESQKKCLELLKESLPPVLKAIYWAKYRDLTKEVKRLRELFQEQSAFASEQIDGAISALEQEIQLFDKRIESAPDVPLPAILQSRASLYQNKQKEITHLNTLAARLNALRKELIKTEMRIRQKNKFLERISLVGDFVFPKRKKLIIEISEAFMADVTAFLKANHFTTPGERSLFQLREDVKSFQQVARVLTLNTEAFTETRLKLSEYWDKIKGAEKERKKEFEEKKLVYKENVSLIHTKIEEVCSSMMEKQPSAHEIERKQQEILKFMHSKALGRDEVRALREQLDQAFRPFRAKLLEEEKKRKEIELEQEEMRQEKIRALSERCHQLQEHIKASQEASNLDQELETLETEIRELELSDREAEVLFRLLTPVRDRLDKEAQDKIFALAPDHPQKRLLLEELFRQVTQKRIELREQLEKYRKVHGTSGLDFEQSLFVNEQIHEEKQRLEVLNATIAKLESEMKEVGFARR